jgi:hypothetical protein
MKSLSKYKESQASSIGSESHGGRMKDVWRNCLAFWSKADIGAKISSPLGLKNSSEMSDVTRET